MPYLWGFFGAYLFARLSAPRFAARNRRRGHVDHPGGRKKQVEPVPYGGGSALVFGVLAPLALSLLLLVYGEPFKGGGPVVHDQREALVAGFLSVWPRLAAIVGGALVLAITGRIDDRRGLPVWLRLLVQIGAALLVVATGTRLGLYLEDSRFAALITVVFLVFITNAFNFIDNMDGLASGGGLAAALGIATIAGLDGQFFVAALAAITGGAFLGVLAHNAAPARMYLGDEGTLFGGFLLGCLAILVSYRSEQGSNTPAWFPFLIPALVLGLPLLDGLFVCLTRPLRGVSPWTAGRDHLSHRLARRLGGREGPPDRVLAVGLLTALAFLGPALGSFLYGTFGSTLRAGILLTLGLMLARLGRRT